MSTLAAPRPALVGHRVVGHVRPASVTTLLFVVALLRAATSPGVDETSALAAPGWFTDGLRASVPLLAAVAFGQVLVPRTRTAVRRSAVVVAAALMVMLAVAVLVHGHVSSSALSVLLLTALGPVLAWLAPERTFGSARLTTRLHAVASCLVPLLVPVSDAGQFERSPMSPALFTPSDAHRFTGLLAHPNLTGAVLATGCLLEWRGASAARVRIAFTVVQFALLVETGSRTSLCALAAAVAVAAIGRRGYRLRALRTLLGVAALPVVGIAAYLLGWVTAVPLSPSVADQRGMVWMTSAVFLRSGWAWGVNADRVLPGLVRPDSLVALTGGAHAHNLLLEGWLIGGVAVLVILVALGVAAAQVSSRTRSAAAGCAMLFVLALTEAPLVALPGSLNLVVAAGLAALIALPRGVGPPG